MAQDLPFLERDSVAAADSTGVVRDVGAAVERLTQVRNVDDAWSIALWFQRELVTFAISLLLALLILGVFALVYRGVRMALRPVFERSKLEEDAAHLLMSIVKYGILGLGTIVALDQLGMNVTGLLAGLGVVGLALGFAAKDTLANFIAGVTILWDRPFRVGDRVTVEGDFGQVKKITLRSTRIHTNQNLVVIIPNQLIANGRIVNHTMQASVRLDVPFGVAYGEDLDRVRSTVLALVAGDDRVRERPAPEVTVIELGESAVNLALRVWLKNPHVEVPAGFEYSEAIKKALDAAGIEIPFPQRTLWIAERPGPATDGAPTPGGPPTPDGPPTPSDREPPAAPA